MPVEFTAQLSASPTAPRDIVNVLDYPVYNVLDLLLQDKTTGGNITLSSDSYLELDDSLTPDTQITESMLRQWGHQIACPRVFRDDKQQERRTRKKAEVFTPSWLCNRMNNYSDEGWFKKKSGFNTESIANGTQGWSVIAAPLLFMSRKPWKRYVDARRMEITCGEAPFIVSRYDAAIGRLIPVEQRIGILDRKLRAVAENASSDEEWHKWVIRAFHSVYGYEFQGDNLLIARVNLLNTYVDHVRMRTGRAPHEDDLIKVANIIAWNFWQMDGLRNTVAIGTPSESLRQPSLFDSFLLDYDSPAVEQNKLCKIFDWRKKRSFSLNTTTIRTVMKFDIVIGNPPYQDTQARTKDMPIYHKFMDAAYSISDKVLLVTPARFLFNAGATGKTWNLQMLKDPHFKVLEYEKLSSNIFSNTKIEGGIAIHYRDANQDFGSIETFTQHPEERSLIKKMRSQKGFSSLSTIMYPYSTYKISKAFWDDFPDKKAEVDYISKNRKKMKASEVKGKLSNFNIITTNIFDLLPDLFYDKRPDDNKQYVCIRGRQNNQRCQKFIEAKYIDVAANYDKWKVVVPKSNSSSPIGTPELLAPSVGYTQSFLGIGCQDSEDEARAILKYICTKFSRALLSILKITQDNPPEKWRYVPLQDFSSKSDIDWNASVAEIDRQLYAKYNLTQEEIGFIEKNVKEMK